MRKYLSLMILFLAFFACRTEVEEIPAVSSEALNFNSSELPKKTRPVGKAAAAVNAWSELRSFDQSLDRIYSVSGREDYALIVEELLELYEIMRVSQAPDALQSPQIISRFNVVKTFLLKVQADLEYRVDAKDSTTELIAAYNAAMDQCNTLVNTTLDPKTLFDE